MKIRLLMLLLITTSCYLFAQESTLPVINGDTLTTSIGYKIIKGENIKIGTGTMPDGDFKFIRTSSASLFNYTSTTGYQGLANQANSYSRSNSGTIAKVARVESRGSKKRGFVSYAIIGGIKKYEIDIENAISSGEIVVPEEFNLKQKYVNTLSVADELKKFKELLDAGAITQDEYNAKKKQLLGL